MIEHKIVFGCNHIINKLTSKPILYTVSRSLSGNADKIDSKGIITDVLYVYQLQPSNLTINYIKKIDYTISDNEITWISEHKPLDGSAYLCEAVTTSREIQDYSAQPQLCERCAGQGWYVDVFSPTSKSVEVARGINKLIQDYLKVLYTQKQPDGYGTNLIDLAGMTVYNTNMYLSDIAAELNSGAIQIQETQSESITSDGELTDDETLVGMEILSMEYDKNDTAAYVDIKLITAAADSSAAISFKF